MNEPKRLHKLYVLFPFFSVMKSIIPILVLLIIKGVNWSKFPWYGYAAAIVVIVLPFVLYGWFTWRKFSYTLQEDRIVLRRGIFVREEKSIYFSRIHSIQTQQPLIQRILRLAQLKIETPGGNAEADGVLPALAIAEAERVEQWLYQKRSEAAKKEEAPAAAEYAHEHAHHEEGESPEQNEGVIQEGPAPLVQREREVLLRLSAGRLFAGALTTMNLPLVVVFGTGVYSFADDLLPDHFYSSLVERAGQLSAIWWLGLVPVMFLLAWILSAVLFTIKYAGFTVEQEGGNITIVSGLLDRKKHVFSPGKVQAVEVKEGLLRQPFGYAEVEIFVLTSETEKKMMLHPLLPLRDVNELLARIVPQFELQPPVTCPPKRALWLFMRWKLLGAAVLGTAGTVFLGPTGALLFLLLPLCAVWGYGCFKDEGMSIQGKLLTLRHRTISRSTALMRRPHVVTVNTVATSGQRSKSLLSVRAKLMVNRIGFKAVFLEREQANAVKDWFRQASAFMKR
ncbi:PH domain-containing protein [Paenibacillus xylanilyticus]|uniref:PH domain-containing protein n=1 Tax=Paenibacillus xylanilyticus TaxID=248903 RepID=A0A7Y6BY34_9BACL|nr:PH domain-containing protein [Paenibacillus xylanilyticus]NUU76084.1 PH domain-containing protein [Paenibacillus xylanilyticus]